MLGQRGAYDFCTEDCFSGKERVSSTVNTSPLPTISECAYAVSSMPFTCQTVFDLNFLPRGSAISFKKTRYERGPEEPQTQHPGFRKHFEGKAAASPEALSVYLLLQRVSEEHINMPIRNGSPFNFGVGQQKKKKGRRIISSSPLSLSTPSPFIALPGQ